MPETISVQCRGAEGKLAKDVGVVIVKSDAYSGCNVDINCPHYIGHQLRTESSIHDNNYGCCKASKSSGFGSNKFFRTCLYDHVKL